MELRTSKWKRPAFLRTFSTRKGRLVRVTANGVNNMFLEANFASVVGGATYGSNTITVELATP